MRRLMLFDHLGNARGEISPNDVLAAKRIEEINGEHSLEITTIQVLEKYDRLVYQDGRGVWREYVITGVDEEHASGKRIIGTYYCVWSVQPDLMGVTVSAMPNGSAGTALDAALSSQTRWTRGTVTNITTASASMYDRSAWAAFGVLLENWGGELSTTIGVGNHGVISRAVDLYAQMGEADAKRRFDFGADLKSVKRTYPDEPFYCRVSPRGKGEETEGGGYGRKITIESVNDGKDYLEYSPMVDVAKLPDGNGGWQYPTLIIENSDCETPQELKDWALSVYADILTPKVTYSVDVLQAGIEGVDFTGVSLGDVVQVVDTKFPGELRLTGRITSMTVDELNEHSVRVKIGYLEQNFSSKFSDLAKAANAAYETAIGLANTLSTAEYIDSLLARINAEINATGGYTYIVQGNGIRTYDRAVTDPIVGSEATQVVEIKGGSIRIANSKTAQGAWEWKTVFQSGFIAADMINAVNITAGRIASADGSSYWDLDNSLLSLSGDILLTMVGYATGAKHYAKMGTFAGYDPNGNAKTFRGLQIYSEGESRSNAILSVLGRTPSNNTTPESAVYASGNLIIAGGTSQNTNMAEIQVRYSVPDIRFYVNKSGTYASVSVDQSQMYCSANFRVPSNYTKNKIAETDNYDERLLYCYESTSPMFADYGSGETDESGICIVSIDDMFAETVRTDCSYQVFLQPCGSGALYVSEKSPGYFLVSGEPNTAFDWNVVARQTGFENLRLENYHLEQAGEEVNADAIAGQTEDAQDQIGQYIEQLERVQYEAA